MVYSINEIREKVAPVAAKYELSAVYLFGSYARNEATEKSDIDILIDRRGAKISGLFQMGGLYNDLCECFGKEVDLVTTGALEQATTKRRTPWFADCIEKEKLKIYG